MFYKNIIRPILFSVDAETVHYRVFSALKNIFQIPLAKEIATNFFTVKNPVLKRKIFGLDFENPIGLAAGFDKNAVLIDELACLGFGFIEIGTLTPKAQAGNPKPRLFRLPADQALINRMGFNNEGVEKAVERLKNRKSKVIVGGNIGKNKDTPNENAIKDYEIAFETLFDHVDYFVVNVSSPNTPNLRALQEKEPLKQLLAFLQNKNQAKPKPKPLLLKIAPDLTNEQLNDIVEIAFETNLAGIIASNTTISRENLNTQNADIQAIGNGGLSGKPLKKRATEVIKYLKARSENRFAIIGVGGIYTAQDAIEKLEAGADLLQVYSGFVYEGASMIHDINLELLKYYQKKMPKK